MNITDEMVAAAQSVAPSLTTETVRQMLAAGIGASSALSEHQLLLAGVARILGVVDRPSSDLCRALRVASGPARDIAE